MQSTVENFFGAIHVNNSGVVIDIDMQAMALLNLFSRKDAIGKNIVSFIPDFSLDDLYVRNQSYNIQILHSVEMIGFSYYKILDKNVQLKVILCKMPFLHELFANISEAGATDLFHLFRRFAGGQDEGASLHATDAKNIVGNSPQIRELLQLVERIAGTDAHILLQGETGVGKTMFAKIIHEASPRNKEPFVEINCATIHKNLIESEFFGYERGAFTGALNQGKIGKIEMANKGTLFLDEITETPPEMQQKLLQVIQDKKINRVGGNTDINVNFRLVTATNRNIEDLVQQGLFRRDLYYRLNVIPVLIPPLRDRISDIIALSMHFTRQVNEKYTMNRSFSKEAIQAFCLYSWPGNVRELKNLVERILLTAQTKIVGIAELPLFIQNVDAKQAEKETLLKGALEKYEKNIILDAYSKYKTSARVGAMLGISQASASRKIRKYLSH